MAVMVTEPIPSNASQGEKTLYGILRDNLPDDFYVWYEPTIEKLHPDFIILGPSFGLLIIEVKGWYPKCIVAGNHDFFHIKLVD
ncbi:MAG: NERD domain-containing protein [Nostoc sp.]